MSPRPRTPAGDVCSSHSPSHAFRFLNPRLRDGVAVHSRRSVLKTSLAGLAGLTALLLALPSTGLAQAKIRVAIWEFENHAEHHWWFYDDLGPAARNQIDTEFSENKMLSEEEVERMQQQVREEVEQVMRFPNESPHLPASALYENIFAPAGAA